MLEQTGNKINCLEGIRGIAAFIVLLHHFTLGFYPAYYSMNAAEGHMDNGNVEKMVGTSMLNFFVNGSMAVSVFFVLSGIVLSYRFFQTKNVDVLRSLAVKRYPRLMLPVLFATLLFYAVKLFDGIYSSEAAEITKSTWWLSVNGNFDMNFRLMLKTTLWDVFFIGNNVYLTVLWTLKTEMFGSFLVFSLLALFGQMPARGFVYGCVFVYFVGTMQAYYLSFLMGIILADWMVNKPQIFTQFNKPFILIPLSAVGFYIASYPASNFVKIEETIYRHFSLSIFSSIELYHTLGTTLLIFSVLCSTLLQKIFTNKASIFLGKISFSMYLLHPIVIASFSSYLIILFKDWKYYNNAVLLIFILTLIVTFIISYLMTIFVDKKSIEMSRKLYNKLSRITETKE
jgi:peptidoglycan/LPS O-acetylase OafA/YrhL